MKSHNLYKHPIYSLWGSMKSRCYCKTATPYKHYGGKGIGVCDEWNNSFMAFYEWAIANGWEKGMSLERRENDKWYTPDNCLFIPKKRQPANRRTNTIFEYNGKKQILADWCREFNIGDNLVRRRMSIGWSFEEAILTPNNNTKK